MAGTMHRHAGTLAELTVSLADAEWDGRTIPTSGICKEGAGRGMSPAIRVAGIPAGCDGVVVEFNDTGKRDLAEYGGLGAIWIATRGSGEVVVPSVPERTLTIPEGVQMEHGHRAEWFGPGAYLAPCSLGAGHLYTAHVMAVQKTAPDGPRLLGEATLNLGVC